MIHTGNSRDMIDGSIKEPRAPRLLYLPIDHVRRVAGVDHVVSDLIPTGRTIFQRHEFRG